MDDYDKQVMRDVQNQKPNTPFMYLFISIVFLGLAINSEVQGILKLVAIFLSGTLFGLGTEKIYSRKIRKLLKQLSSKENIENKS